MRAPLSSSSPISARRRVSALVGLLAVTALLVAGCGGDDGDEVADRDDATTTTTEAPASSTTTEAPTTATTEAPSSETTASTPAEDDGGPGTTTGSTEGQLSPGDPCSLEEGDPDCIDPDGDGEGTYLTGGAECAADAPDISICEDLDGDGVAGYPDEEYGDLPTCGEDVPPPCNNPPGSGDEG